MPFSKRDSGSAFSSQYHSPSCLTASGFCVGMDSGSGSGETALAPSSLAGLLAVGLALSFGFGFGAGFAFGVFLTAPTDSSTLATLDALEDEDEVAASRVDRLLAMGSAVAPFDADARLRGGMLCDAAIARVLAGDSRPRRRGGHGR